ncbi:MAG: VOC family protein, partial [Chloroflexota bacterium]|nr:VOC family protein [Chloroflexota bacterium]
MLTQRRVHSTIPAADLDRARSWYADRLGFEPIRELPGGLMYDAAESTRFVIFPSPNAGKSPNTIMGFATPDVEAEVRELKARGVVFEEYDYPTLRTVNSIATVGPT